MTAAEILTSTTPVTLTSEQAAQLESFLDRALVAIFTGAHRRPDGNGVGFAPAWDAIPALVRRQLVQVEEREIGTPLVWLTDAGHEVIDDIQEEGGFWAHVAAVRQ